MNKKHIASVAVALVMAIGFLGGCSTVPTKTETGGYSEEAFSKSMAEAGQVAATRDKDGSIRMYQKIAAANPSRAEPWSQISQIRFDQGSYSLAIVAAEEALKRDPSNRQAKSITVVGGLRLATRSLEDLRADSSLTGDTKDDARQLANSLRQTLGTNVLVPAGGGARSPSSTNSTSATTATTSRRPARNRTTGSALASSASSTPAVSGPKTTAPPPPPPAQQRSGGNPFDALK